MPCHRARPYSRRAALALVGACSATLALPRASRAAAEAPVTVVTTTGMIADMARAIGGGEVRVRSLMGPGIDPHSYRQTRTDILALTRADLVLWNGLYLEAQMEEFLLRLARRQPVVAVAETLPREALLSHPSYPQRHDPHVWMAPLLWAEVAPAVTEALARLRPDAAERLADAEAAWRARLARLHAYVAEISATIPAESRVLVTAHDAFRYFGRAYGFEVLGIQGISTESEAGLNRIEELVTTIVERRIGAVFVESSVPERNVRALIEGAAARGHAVRLGGELFSDAMGPEGSYEGSYEGMIDHNATVIARALGGTAPARGLYGRLSAEIPA